jgi:hypothetical protein
LQQRSSAIACLWKTIPALNIRSFILENFEPSYFTDVDQQFNQLCTRRWTNGRGISRCFSRDEKAILQKIIPILIFQNANQPYSKWWSHLKYYERKIICCRAILVNLGGKGKMCVQIMMVVRLPLILIFFTATVIWTAGYKVP